MIYLVFSQANKELPDEAALVNKARTYFRIGLRFTSRRFRGEGDAQRGEFTVELDFPGHPSATLTLARRVATEDDWRAAELAEQRGRATGMGTLARRCKVVWEVTADEGPSTLLLCAILAANELGPVMPPDGSTLYGVRGARERAGV